MREAGMEEAEAGVRMGGRIINNLRYADDVTLLTEKEDELSVMASDIQAKSQKAGLKLNAKKTKVMATSNIQRFNIGNEEVEVVDSFTYLGVKISVDGGCSEEIKRRIAMGRTAMTGLTRVWKDREITTHTKYAC